jgi:hypothetical protein
MDGFVDEHIATFDNEALSFETMETVIQTILPRKANY